VDSVTPHGSRGIPDITSMNPVVETLQPGIGHKLYGHLAVCAVNVAVPEKRLVPGVGLHPNISMAGFRCASAAPWPLPCPYSGLDHTAKAPTAHSTDPKRHYRRIACPARVSSR